MKKYINSALTLTVICAVVSLLLAAANYITAPIIEKQQMAATEGALVEVLPGGEDFVAVDITKYDIPETIIEAYKEKNGGYVFKMETSGYSSGLVIMCGINAEGTLTGATWISSNETLGYEKTYGEKLVGADFETIDSVDTVTKATMTTGAYKSAVKDALGAFIIIGGGSADLRTEEEIFADNLNNALNSADGKFTSVLITEELSENYRVFKADNNSGYVFVLEDSFIATDNNGTVLSEAEDKIKTAVSADAEKIIKSKLNEIEISKYPDIPSAIEKAYKTDSGNYVFDIKASGYGINGDKYTASGEYIKIRVSATESGKIICCQTVYQNESKGYGAACAEYEFYAQFDGKTKDNYSDIDAISGATITTNGYKSAVSKVFDAITILEKGAN